jgi:predicted secreted protein
MTPLAYMGKNPIETNYAGEQTLSIQAVRDFYNSTAQNFNTMESVIRRIEDAQQDLQNKLNASYDFIAWVQTHAPGTMTAYKAHKTVVAAFDKAESSEGYAKAVTAGG